MIQTIAIQVQGLNPWRATTNVALLEPITSLIILRTILAFGEIGKKKKPEPPEWVSCVGCLVVVVIFGVLFWYFNINK